MYYLLFLFLNVVYSLSGSEAQKIVPHTGSELILWTLRSDPNSSFSWREASEYSAHDIIQIRYVNKFLCNKVDDTYITLRKSFDILQPFKPLLILCNQSGEWCMAMYPRVVSKLKHNTPLTLFYGVSTEQKSLRQHIFCAGLPARVMSDRLNSINRPLNIFLGTSEEKTVYQFFAGTGYFCSLFPSLGTVDEPIHVILDEYIPHMWVEKAVAHKDWHSKRLFTNPHGDFRLCDISKDQWAETIFEGKVGPLTTDNQVKPQIIIESLYTLAQKHGQAWQEQHGKLLSFFCAGHLSQVHLLSPHGLRIIFPYTEHTGTPLRIVQKEKKLFFIEHKKSMGDIIFSVWACDADIRGDFELDNRHILSYATGLRYTRNAENILTGVEHISDVGKVEIITINKPVHIMNQLDNSTFKKPDELFAAADTYDKILQGKGTQDNPLTTIPSFPTLTDAQMQQLKNHPLYCNFTSCTSRVWSAFHSMHNTRLYKHTSVFYFMDMLHKICIGGTIGAIGGICTFLYKGWYQQWREPMNYMFCTFFLANTGWSHYANKKHVAQGNPLWQACTMSAGTMLGSTRFAYALCGPKWLPVIAATLLPLFWMSVDCAALTYDSPAICIPFSDIYNSWPARLQRKKTIICNSQTISDTL